MVTHERLKTIALKIAFYGGVATFLAINSVPFIISQKIRKSEHYKQAMELLRSHPEAIKYMGEPIIGKRVNSTKEENYGTNGEITWLQVPVMGPKGKGKLYYDFSAKRKENDPIQLSRVELSLNNLKDYKLLIKRTE